MRRLICILILTCGAFAQTPNGELTAEQKATFQRSLSEFYRTVANAAMASAAFERELSDRAKELRAELNSRQQIVTERMQALKASCPGDLIDDPEGKKPAECKPKAEVKPTEKSKENQK